MLTGKHEQTYLLAKKMNEYENCTSPHKMVENFRKSWVLLVYLSQRSHILD